MSENRLNRPVYVLGHHADVGGCGTHRILRPMELLSRLGIISARADMHIWPDDVLRTLAPDVVIWQRQHEDHQLAHMERYRKALPNAFMIYEIDDALSIVPEASWHRSFMPDDIEERIARAVKFCDVITVTTRALAQYMRSICGDGIEIRLVPNMLGRDDFQNAQAARLANLRLHKKPRIGWGGGISHSGDLALIAAAIDELADEMQWVFLGMKPEGLKSPVEFHEGVSPREYLAKLASLDLDLMVAPLEDNLFNRCKSNLRLIEAGACGYPVIASPLENYVDGNPPVYAYAEPTAASWVEKIRGFIALDANAKQVHGNKLKAWAERSYCLDEHAEERARLWLPGNKKPFKPKHNASASGVTIVCSSPNASIAALGDVRTSLADAMASTGDVLYVAPNTVVTQAMIDRLRAHLSQYPTAAAVSALSNDGGLCGFPRPWQFGAIDQTHGLEIDALAAAEFPEESIEIPFPSGPLTLLSRRAIAAWGAPEACAPGREEEALIEWGVLMTSRGLRARCAPNVFAPLAAAPQPKDIPGALRRSQMRYPPINMPPDPLSGVRARLELVFHRERYKLPLPTPQSSYEEWAAFFDTPGRNDLAAMKRESASLPDTPKFAIALPRDYVRIEPQTWPSYKALSAATVKAAIALAGQNGCDWIIFPRQDSTIRPHAFYMLTKAIAQNPQAVMIYADHDYLDKEGKRCDHDFKPATFSLDLLLARDYVSPFCAMRLSALKELPVGDEDTVGEAMTYRLALRLAGNGLPAAPTADADGVKRAPDVIHVPRILCHLKQRDHFREASTTVVKTRIATTIANEWGWAVRVTPHTRGAQWGHVSYWPDESRDEPLVSIIVPTKNRLDMLKPCIESLLHITKYRNFELLIVDNGSDNPEHAAYLAEVKKRDGRIRLFYWPETYNWSALNNWAAKRAKGEYLLLLNDDTRIVDHGWLGEMVGCAARPGVGAVGARLLYPWGMVQHVGVVASNGMTGHIHKGLAENAPGYNGIAMLSHEATAVTGACFLIRNDLFFEIGALDESLAHNFNDVELCLRLLKCGFRNIVAASAQVHHLEGQTRIGPDSHQGIEILHAEAKMLQALHPDPEPYWNPNLIFVHQQGGAFVSGLSYDIFAWPPARWPWRGDTWPMERVMVVGDDGAAFRAEVQEGNAAYIATTEGFMMRVAQPPLENVPPFDIRAPQEAKLLFERLGIDRIVVRSLVGAPLELLSFLMQLDVKLDYRPFVAEAACPRLNFLSGGKQCGAGWRDGLCQQCIDLHGSPFGQVSMVGWRDVWRRFLAAAACDFSNLDDTARTAINDSYERVAPKPSVAAL